uniref:Otoancorin n=1 Tax=Lates calcarifer TaxID=8187 RepID=A0A4W6FUI4_LATCA
MAPKGGTFLFLLIVACAVMANLPTMKPNEHDYKDMAKKLMAKCQKQGYQVPKMMLLNTVFDNSNLPMNDRNADTSNPTLTAFLDVLSSATGYPNKDSISQKPMDDSDKMTTQMWNCTHLTQMIRQMRNCSEASACYMRAFVALKSWKALITQGENNMDPDDYDTLLWAAKPALEDMASSGVSLPPKVDGGNMKKMMITLREVHATMSDDQRSEVAKWAKEQIAQNNFNCTMMPPSDSRSTHMERCKPSLEWLDLDAMTEMGPYLSHLASSDLDSSPKEKLCEFFHSTKLKSSISETTKIKPSLGTTFLQKVKECFGGKMEFAQHVDKLGALACFYFDPPHLTSDLAKKFLSELDNCEGPRITSVKKHLVKSLFANSSPAEALTELGSSVTLLTPRQLSEINGTDLKEVLKKLGDKVKWTKAQLRTLVKKQLGDDECKDVSGEELKALQSVAEGVPNCVLKRVKAREILDDTEALKNISKRMKKAQLKAMLQGLHKDMDPSELVKKLSGPLLHSVSLNRLEKANITSLEEVGNKTWSQSQAAYLARKMQKLKKNLQFWKLHSVIQGITCKMVDNVADSDTRDMAEAMTETPQWLSKVQAGCAARKLFVTLEKERADYFKTITGDELGRIPTLLLIHLWPSKVKDLPDSVCPIFLDKMEMANLSSLSLHAPSRPALTQKALHCLANGTDLSVLTTNDMSRLGPLLCELSASQLRLMAPEVINSNLQAMASCQHIPKDHRADLIQLVNQTFGNPSDWSPETMEMLSPLLILDDNAISALPNKPWMKDILYFLESRMSLSSDALRKKLFSLATTSNTTSNAVRRKRAADSNNGSDHDKVPTVQLIEELQMENVYWTAAQLDLMSKDTFLATVEILGSICNYNADQLAVLSKKAAQAFGPVSQMTENDVMQMGCITQGLSDADLEKLPLPLDAMEGIAHCGWNDSQMEPLWKGVAKYNNLTAEKLEAAEMVALNRSICGLSSTEIQQLNKEAFKDAVGSMDGIQCSFKVTQQLKTLAMSAFGEPSSWTEAQVADLGNIIAGLDANELASLDPPVFSFVKGTCIPRIPPDNFAALSVVQLQALGPDNAAVVTAEQRAALENAQQDALDRAVTGSSEQPSRTSESGKKTHVHCC